MGLLSWLLGNRQAKRNNVKIARVKKELQLMTREQKIKKLRGLQSNLYTKTNFDRIDNIYACDYDLTTDFLIYYLLFVNNDIRNEVEMGISEAEINEIAVAGSLLPQAVKEAPVAEVVAEPVVETVVEPVVEVESVVEKSSYDSGFSYDSGNSCGGCDSGGDCGGCD